MWAFFKRVGKLTFICSLLWFSMVFIMGPIPTFLDTQVQMSVGSGSGKTLATAITEGDIGKATAIGDFAGGFLFDDSTAMTDPSAWYVRVDDADPTAVTEIVLDYSTFTGTRLHTLFLGLLVGDSIFLYSDGDLLWTYTLTLAPTDETGYIHFPGVVNDGSSRGTITDEDAITVGGRANMANAVAMALPCNADGKFRRWNDANTTYLCQYTQVADIRGAQVANEVLHTQATGVVTSGTNDFGSVTSPDQIQLGITEHDILAGVGSGEVGVIPHDALRYSAAVNIYDPELVGLWVTDASSISGDDALNMSNTHANTLTGLLEKSNSPDANAEGAFVDCDSSYDHGAAGSDGGGIVMPADPFAHADDQCATFDSDTAGTTSTPTLRNTTANTTFDNAPTTCVMYRYFKDPLSQSNFNALRMISDNALDHSTTIASNGQLKHLSAYTGAHATTVNTAVLTSPASGVEGVWFDVATEMVADSAGLNSELKVWTSHNADGTASVELTTRAIQVPHAEVPHYDGGSPTFDAGHGLLTGIRFLDSTGGAIADVRAWAGECTDKRRDQFWCANAAGNKRRTGEATCDDQFTFKP